MKKIIATVAVSLAASGSAAAQLLPQINALGLGETMVCDALMAKLDKDYSKTQSLQTVVLQMKEGRAQKNCRGDRGCELADAATQCLGRWMQSRLAKGWNP